MEEIEEKIYNLFPSFLAKEVVRMIRNYESVPEVAKEIVKIFSSSAYDEEVKILTSIFLDPEIRKIITNYAKKDISVAQAVVNDIADTLFFENEKDLEYFLEEIKKDPDLIFRRYRQGLLTKSK